MALFKVMIAVLVMASLMHVTTAGGDEPGAKRFPGCDHFCDTDSGSVTQCCQDNQTETTELPSLSYCQGGKVWCSWGKEAPICLLPLSHFFL